MGCGRGVRVGRGVDVGVGVESLCAKIVDVGSIAAGAVAESVDAICPVMVGVGASLVDEAAGMCDEAADESEVPRDVGPLQAAV